MAEKRTISRDRLTMTAWLASIACVIALAVAVYPVFSHHFVSMNDVYNHVARAPVLAHYRQDAAYQTYWIPNWRLVPYVGFDLVAVALLPFFSLGLIVKLMVTATIVSMLAGAVLLSRAAHGKWTATALICVLLLLNRTLLAGFINYLFGIGLALMGAAAWMAMRQRGLAARLAVLALFATALCAIHLFACAVLGITVAGIELGAFTLRPTSLWRLLKSVATPVIAFIPAFLLVIFVAPHPGFHLAWRGLSSRLEAFAVPLTYAPAEEAAGLLVIALAVAALWATGRVHIDRRLAIAAGLLTLFQLAMPADVGTATVVDHRLPIAIWLLLVCAIEIRIERAALAAGFMALVAVVFITRVSIIQHRWTQDNVVYAEAQRAFAALPGDARVATAYPASGLNSATRPDVALYYMPALEFVPKGGFTQILWTIPDQHPLIMRPQFRQLTNKTAPEELWRLFVTDPGQNPASASRGAAMAAVEDYDYIAFLDARPFDVHGGDVLQPVRTAPQVRIFKVLHPARRIGLR